MIRHATNLGVTAALESGARSAKTPVTVVLDADLSYAPQIIESLVAHVYRRGAACVIASPYMRGGCVAGVPFARRLLSLAANRLLAFCAGGRVKTLTGMVRAYDANVLGALLERRPSAEFNSWAVAELLADRKLIVEIPARLAWPRNRLRSRGRFDLAATRRRTWGVLLSAGSLLGSRDAERARPRAISAANVGTFGP